MTIARKPKLVAAGNTARKVDVDALINKGGSVATERKPSNSTAESVQVALRIPADILASIDAKVAERPIKMPRHTWILEALVEKLEREGQDYKSSYPPP